MNPGAIEETGKVATGIVESLKNQPVVLAMVVFNCLFVVVVFLGMRQNRESLERLTTRFTEVIVETSKLLYNCTPDRREKEP